MIRGLHSPCFATLRGGARPLLPRPPAPDLVLFNGKVITVDRSFSIHEAVAITGDRIMAVGNDDQMKTVAGPATRHDRSQGPRGDPGVDGQPSARRRRRARRGSLSRAVDGGCRRPPLRRACRHRRPGDVIVSNSDWHEAQLKEQRLPLRDDLDRVAPAESRGPGSRRS